MATEEKNERASLLGIAGTPGLKHHGGYVREEFHKNLAGTKAAKVYREIRDNHPLVGGAFSATRFLIGQVRYYVEKTGDTPEHEAAQKFCESVIDDLDRPLRRIINEFLDVMTFGWAYGEKLFKIRRGPEELLPEFRSDYEDGLIGLRDIAFRAQESLDRWDIARDGSILGMWQRSPTSGETLYIPRSKSVLFRLEESKNNPEGRSALRNVYTSYYHQKHIKFVEGVGIERRLAGYPVMEVPPHILSSGASSTDQATKTACEQIVQGIKVDSLMGAVIPAEMYAGEETGYKLRTLNDGGAKRSI